MKTGITELVLVIGKSRSDKYAEECAKGFETLFFRKKMNVLQGEVILTTILFDDSCHIVHDRVDIHGAEPFIKDDFIGKGNSAWTSAIGSAIDKTDAVLRHTSEEFRPDKVVYVIITDGMVSAQYEQYVALKEKITQSKNNGGKFFICGYDVDAFTECSCVAWKIGLDYENVSGAFRHGCEKEFFIGLLGDISRSVSGKADNDIFMYTTDWWQKLYTKRADNYMGGATK